MEHVKFTERIRPINRCGRARSKVETGLARELCAGVSPNYI